MPRQYQTIVSKQICGVRQTTHDAWAVSDSQITVHRLYFLVHLESSLKQFGAVLAAGDGDEGDSQLTTHSRRNTNLKSS